MLINKSKKSLLDLSNTLYELTFITFNFEQET
jgi:hypothetical protein